MGAFNHSRFEALAKGVAAGASVRAAGIAAGWGRNTRTYYRYAKRPDFAAEVERWKLELRRGGSSDLGPVITDLMGARSRPWRSALGPGWRRPARCWPRLPASSGSWSMSSAGTKSENGWRNGGQKTEPAQAASRTSTMFG